MKNQTKKEACEEASKKANAVAHANEFCLGWAWHEKLDSQRRRREMK